MQQAGPLLLPPVQLPGHSGCSGPGGLREGWTDAAIRTGWAKAGQPAGWAGPGRVQGGWGRRQDGVWAGRFLQDQMLEHGGAPAGGCRGGPVCPWMEHALWVGAAGNMRLRHGAPGRTAGRGDGARLGAPQSNSVRWPEGPVRRRVHPFLQQRGPPPQARAGQSLWGGCWGSAGANGNGPAWSQAPLPRPLAIRPCGRQQAM